MGKMLVTLFLFFLFISTSFSQERYSKANLEQASKDDLYLYLTKAQKLKKTGKVISIVGVSVLGTGTILVLTNRETAGYVGLGMWVIGAGITLVGLPILSEGTSRVKKVSKVWNTKYNAALIDFVPCNLFNYQTQQIQPGISLRIRF